MLFVLFNFSLETSQLAHYKCSGRSFETPFQYPTFRMLLLKPVWIYAVVSFWVSCARGHFSTLRNIWDSSYFSCIVVVMSSIFVPLETWIVLRNFEWDTMFGVSNHPHSVSVVLAAANLAHVLSAVVGCVFSVHILQSYGISALIRMSIGSFTLFFCSIGVFQDTLLYAGSSEEYHKGVPSTLFDFISSGTFHDSYLIFSLVFGPPFVGLSIVWNSGYTPQDRHNFISSLYTESWKQILFTNGAMVSLWMVGLLPQSFGLFCMGLINFLVISTHLCVITPLLLSRTKESVK